MKIDVCARTHDPSPKILKEDYHKYLQEYKRTPVPAG